ncbi:MAG TPA: HyaD/HybD family hydrogenase maturation endopeptidase [Ktedonobacterales bacterium]|jgi:hydrogenase maturation protease|nr:HyaD/HybD family hydrogenase maturation endopeptidase [Ktedonobacterales bacterium]
MTAPDSNASTARNSTTISAEDEESAPEIVVLGLGNRLRRDEGLGICALERLYQRYTLPSGVQLVDGGVLGLELLAYVESTRRLLVLDAALTGGEPGDLLRLEDDQAPAYLGMRASPHEIGLADLLAVAQLRGRSPESVVILGMQPDTIELGWELTPAVASRLDHLVEAAVVQLAAWGYAPQPRPQPTHIAPMEVTSHA